MAIYANRALRLYPTYWVVLLLSIAMLVVAQMTGKNSKLAEFTELAVSSQIFLVAANVLLFGQDVACFLQEVPREGMAFTSNFTQAPQPLIRFLAVPQAWSLAIELLFYWLIPFIFQRPRIIIFLLIASLGLRMAAILDGFGSIDPWSYSFFPFEHALFLLGVLSHQYLLPLTRPFLRANPRSGGAAVAMCVGSLLLYPLVDAPEELKWVGIVIFFAITLPLLLDFSARNLLDKSIGDLSYAVYLAHLLILTPLLKVYQGPKTVSVSIAVALTFAFAVIVNRTVEVWVERYRDRIRSNKLVIS